MMIQKKKPPFFFRVKFRKISVFFLMMGLWVMTFSLLVLPISQLKTLESSSPSQDFMLRDPPKISGFHTPIYIDGDDWTLYYPEINGSGTFNDPYMIINLTIDAEGSTGIYIHNSVSFGIIQNCTILNGLSGIYLPASSNVRLTGNTLINISGNGILLSFSSNCTLTNNTLNNNPRGGISLQDSPNCTLKGNYVSHTSSQGISLSSSPNCKIMENVATANQQGGIGLWSSPNCTLIGNTASYNREIGFYIFTSFNCMIVDNIATNNGNGDFDIWNSSSCTLIGNNFVIPILTVLVYKSEIIIFPGDSVKFSQVTTGGHPPMTYFWDFGDGDGINSTSQPVTHSFTTAGTYTVALMVTDCDGKMAISNTTIIVRVSTINPYDSFPFIFDDSIDNLPGYSTGMILLSVGIVVFLIVRRKLIGSQKSLS